MWVRFVPRKIAVCADTRITRPICIGHIQGPPTCSRWPAAFLRFGLVGFYFNIEIERLTTTNTDEHLDTADALGLERPKFPLIKLNVNRCLKGSQGSPDGLEL